MFAKMELYGTLAPPAADDRAACPPDVSALLHPVRALRYE